MSNERIHFRFGVTVDVEVEMPNGETSLFKTKNLSEGGIFLEVESILAPPLGVELYCKVKQPLGDGEEEPPRIKVKVMHSTELGIGLQFVEE